MVQVLGKVFFLKNMYNYVPSKLGIGSVRILGATGVCSKTVNGQTIQSFLRLGRGFRIFFTTNRRKFVYISKV